jgi:hypothetical protein
LLRKTELLNILQPKHLKRLANHLPHLVIVWRTVLEGLQSSLAKLWCFVFVHQPCQLLAYPLSVALAGVLSNQFGPALLFPFGWLLLGLVMLFGMTQ